MQTLTEIRTQAAAAKLATTSILQFAQGVVVLSHGNMESAKRTLALLQHRGYDARYAGDLEVRVYDSLSEAYR